MQRNIEKLKARYGEKFSEKDAEHRNLDKEREISRKETLKKIKIDKKSTTKKFRQTNGLDQTGKYSKAFRLYDKDIPEYPFSLINMGLLCCL